MNQPNERRLSDARPAFKSRSATRRLLERLLHGRCEVETTSRGRLMLETLEPRQMLAGDVEMFSTAFSTPDDSYTPAQYDASNLQAEGEAADDLVAFAQALTDAGVTFYGAAWCPVCLQQKTLFGDGKEELPFVEVTNPDRTLNSVGQAENITQFPTWEFPDSSRAVGLLTLQELSARSGVAIPQSENPTLAPVGDQTVEIGSPLHIPIDAYDPDGNAVTVTVTVANPELLTATVLQGNRSARVNVQGWGSMVFELFEDRAPRPTARFIELAQAGFFDADGDDSIIFHRIIDDFVLQAGDPTGTGSGGSTLGDFDDQFHPDLQHNRTGILSYAKSFDDTNDSQFFITEGATRHLDFNHSIFGQLVEGETVREAISETKTTSDRPDVPVVIDSVEIFNDTENSVLMFKPTGNGTGATDVTITVTDADGNVSTEVITVTVTPDSVDATPYLEDIAPVTTTAGTPAVIQLEGVDLEGDPVVYEARVIDNSGATATVNQATGRVTVTPAANYSGQVLVEVAVRSSTTPTSTNASTRSSTMDLQVVPVTVGPIAPTGITLNASSDSGLSNSDGITKTTPLSFTVTGVTAGATVEVLAGNVQIGVGTATTSSIVITTNNFAALGNAVHLVTARQTVGGVQSTKSPSITVTYDTVAPGLSPVIPSQASVGVPYLANMQNAEEGSGFRYALSSGPAGLTVNPTSGAISWTPTAAQAGDQSMVVTLTDAAGNSREQTYTINVGSDPKVTIRLEAVNASGDVITQLVPGQEFKVNVYGTDERSPLIAQQVFSLYTDLIFQADLAEAVAENPIEYGPMYGSGKRGTVSPGLIDEVGAFASQTSPDGPGERLIFSVNMRALAGGNLTIASDPADGDTTEVTLLDEDNEVSDNRIAYGALSLTINSTFTATNDTATVAEDSTNNTINPLTNDTIIASGTTLTISEVSETSADGTVTIVNNQLRYTPPANFVGVDTFTYTVSDQNGGTQTATVSVTVQGENDPPVAVNDTAEVIEDSTLNQINVLANDTMGPDTGETLRVTAVGSTSNGGTVTIGSSGAHILYTPAAGFTGTDTFTYTLSDGTLTDTATVTVTVVAGNPPPTAVNDSFTLLEDAVAADYDVLANDSTNDPDETFTILSVGTTSNGTVSRTSDGMKLRYKPNANFNGVDKVTYTIKDSNGATATATATFTVTGVNDPPPAPAQTAQMAKGNSNVQVLHIDTLNAANVDGTEALTITAVGTTASGGTVTIASDGKSVRYTPPSATYTGSDSFTYTVTDPSGATTTGTLAVSVLDYIPRDFIVSLAPPSSTSGGSSTDYYANFPVSLTGSDYNGTPVTAQGTYQAPTTANPQGSIHFEDLPPGNYEVVVPPVPFLQNAEEQRFTINSAADETDAVVISVDVGSLQPERLSIRDFLNSTPKSHVFAVVPIGGNATWIAATDNATTPGNPVISLSANGQQVRIEVDAASGSGRRAATLPISDSRIEVRGSEGNYRLLRINVDPAAVTYAAVTSSSSAAAADAGSDAGSGAGSGEGEAAPASVAASSSANASETDSAATTNASDSTSTSTNSSGSTSSNPSSNPSLAGEGESSGDSAPQSSTAQPESRATNPLAGPLVSQFLAEGEATPPLESLGSGANPSDDDSSDESSPAPLLSNVFEGASLSGPQAVDQAMLELLPRLELRSSTADALADPDESQNLLALDQTFGLLEDDTTL